MPEESHLRAAREIGDLFAAGFWTDDMDRRVADILARHFEKPAQPVALSNDAIDEVLVGLEVVMLALRAIADKRRIVGDVVEPVRTINDAALLARAAAARLDRAIIALTPRTPQTSPAPAAQRPCMAHLPEHETPAMHDAAMNVLYNGNSFGLPRTRTNELWQAYRAALLAEAATAAQPSAAQPLTEAQAIALWHSDHEAHERLSAWEWYAAGIIAAERAHGITG